MEQKIRPVGQAVKTPPSHGGNGGSIPPRVMPRVLKELALYYKEITINCHDILSMTVFYYIRKVLFYLQVQMKITLTILTTRLIVCYS